MSYSEAPQKMELNSNEIVDFKNGKKAVFAKFIEVYKDRIYNNVIRFVCNQNDAEEITQRVFIKCYQECSKFRGEAKLSVWIFRIAYNESLNFLKKRNKWVFDEVISHNRRTIQAPIVFENLERQDKKELIEKAMRILKADERWVLILWCYEDLSYNEIAVYTGFTLSNVKIKLHRAKQQLKQELEPFKNHFYE